MICDGCNVIDFTHFLLAILLCYKQEQHTHTLSPTNLCKALVRCAFSCVCCSSISLSVSSLIRLLSLKRITCVASCFLKTYCPRCLSMCAALRLQEKNCCKCKRRIAKTSNIGNKRWAQDKTTHILRSASIHLSYCKKELLHETIETLHQNGITKISQKPWCSLQSHEYDSKKH